MFSSNFHIDAFLNVELIAVQRTDGFIRSVAIHFFKIYNVCMYVGTYNLA